MRRVSGSSKGLQGRAVGLVISMADLARSWAPELLLFALVDSQAEVEALLRLHSGGVRNIVPITKDEATAEQFDLAVKGTGVGLELGDVIAVPEGQRVLYVLYRESDQHHTIFVTNRCNSYCIMCSQPPTKQEDGWLIEEGVRIIMHMRKAPPVVGFTGGEPLLAGVGLRRLIDETLERHPHTLVEVLTNGRRFSDSKVADLMLAELPARVSWMVPLYGHADFLHDYVVQAPGAFDETIAGLLALREYEQQIQLRIVLVAPVLENLSQICEFVAKNLLFVSDVALMGCEPTGFALANRERCEVDYEKWGSQLEEACSRLMASCIRPVIMNIPFCLIPEGLRKYSVKSISDWKRVYPADCEGCTARDSCCGLFASYSGGWKPGRIQPLVNEVG